MYVYDLRHPLGGISLYEGDVQNCEKITFFNNHLLNKRHVIECSAFYTKASAVKSLIGCLSVMIRSPYLKKPPTAYI